MDCPKSYQNIYFMRDCVNPAVKELSQGYFDGLTVLPIRSNKRGRPVVAYEFTFTPSKDPAGDPDPKEQRPRKARSGSQEERSGNKFKNFHEREYDYAALEKQLLRQKEDKK